MRFQESFLLLLVVGVGCYGTTSETEASVLSDPKPETSMLPDPKTKASVLPDAHLRPNRARAADDRRFHEGKVHASDAAEVSEERFSPSFMQLFGFLPGGYMIPSAARGVKKLIVLPKNRLRRTFRKRKSKTAGNKRRV